MENREAIAALKTLCNTCTMFPICVNNKPECFQAIEAAISALEKQEQDRWIPVTERLPEKDGHYLVTLFDEIDSWTEPLYWNTTFGGRWQGLIEDDFSDIGNVSAWRPLPEAYREEEA